MGGQHHAPATLTPGKTRYPLYRGLGEPQNRSGQVRKNLVPTGIRLQDRPAHSKSLYRLSYPGSFIYIYNQDISPLKPQDKFWTCPRSLFMSFVWFLEQTVDNVPNSTDWPDFVQKTRFVCCEKLNLCILYARPACFKRPKEQNRNKIIRHELNEFYLSNKMKNDINDCLHVKII